MKTKNCIIHKNIRQKFIIFYIAKQANLNIFIYNESVNVTEISEILEKKCSFVQIKLSRIFIIF